MDSLRLILIILGVLIVAGIYLWTRQRARSASELSEDLLSSPLSEHRDEWDVIPVVRAPAEPLPGASQERAPPPAAAAEPDPFAALAGLRQTPPPEAAAEGVTPSKPPQAKKGEAAERAEPSWGDGRRLDEVAKVPERREPVWEERATEPATQPSATNPEVAEPEAPPETDALHEEMLVVMTVMAPTGDQFIGALVRDAMAAAKLQFGEMNVYHWSDPRSGQAVFSLANVLNPGTFDPDNITALRTPGLAMFMQLPGPVAGGAAFDIMLETARRIAAELGGRVCDLTRRPLTERAINELRQQAARLPAQP